MQRPREQLLARAALAAYQDRGVGSRGAMELLRHLPELRVLADDPRRAATFCQLFLQEHVLAQHAAPGQGTLDDEQQVIGVDGLGQEVGSAFLHRGHRVLDASVGRHHDHRKFRVVLVRSAHHAKAVTSRELQVRQHQGRPRLPQLLHRLRFVRRLDNRVPLRLERVPEHGTERILVFDQKDRERRHLCG